MTIADVLSPATFTTTPPGFDVTVYSLIGTPPSETGAPHVTVAPVATFAVASASVGAVGVYGFVSPLDPLDVPLEPPDVPPEVPLDPLDVSGPVLEGGSSEPEHAVKRAAATIPIGARTRVDMRRAYARAPAAEKSGLDARLADTNFVENYESIGCPEASRAEAPGHQRSFAHAASMRSCHSDSARCAPIDASGNAQPRSR